MKPVRKENNAIQGRLLKSSCEIFAQKGYRDTTVAEICEKAGANVAAVNYYFGNKETLYMEAWRIAFQQSLEKYPPDGGVPASAPVEERLHGRILSVMRRFTDPQSYEFEIMHKELANPTGLLAEVTHKTIEPLRRELGGIVRELLGEKATEQQVMLCQMSIRAQCFELLIRERRRQVLPEGEMKTGLLPEDITVETLADHVTRFSLAGIREIRQQIENAELNGVVNAAKNNCKHKLASVSPSALESRESM